MPRNNTKQGEQLSGEPAEDSSLSTAGRFSEWRISFKEMSYEDYVL